MYFNPMTVLHFKVSIQIFLSQVGELLHKIWRNGESTQISSSQKFIAKNLSPLGYCRGGVQDGSFGSPTNPKAGGEQSDWIKKNAKSGGGRNEEYYGQIEDDNRQGNIQVR